MAQPKKPDLIAISHNVSKIRNSKNKDEAYRESLAREYIARRYIRPLALTQFPAGIKAILITGSSQRHVRKASAHAEGSDLDLIFVFQKAAPHLPGKTSHFDLHEEKRFLEKLSTQVSSAFGVYPSIQAYTDAEFLHYYSSIGKNFPHGVIHGNAWVSKVRSIHGHNWRDKMKEQIEKLKLKSKFLHRKLK